MAKLKLEYPLALHQNLPKKPRLPFIPILSAASLVSVRRLGDLLRRGAGACLRFGSRASLRGCARCSTTDPKTAEQPTHDRRLGPILSTVLAPAVFMEGSRFSPNCDKLNRQTHEFKNAVTYRKQTTASHSNRQNSQFCPSVFFAQFRPDAASAIPPRIPRA